MTTPRGNGGNGNGPGLLNKNGALLPPSPSYLQQQQEAERHERLNKAWKHYTGDLTGHFRNEPGQPDINVLSNRAMPIVDTGVDFLYGKTVTFEVLLNGKPQKDAQAVLDGCWGNDNRRMVTLSKLGQNGGIFGHAFGKIIEPQPDKRRPYCRVVPLDPAQVTVMTQSDDCDTVQAYIIDYNAPASPAFQQLTVGRRQVIVRIDPDMDADDYFAGDDPDSHWEISNWVRGPNNQWYQQGAPIIWEHPWAPVVDWQNLPLANAHWGMSDIPPNIQHLNSVLNLALSNVNAIAKHHSFPWLYASGVGLGATIELAPGKITQLQAPEGKLGAVEAHGDLAGLLEFANDIRGDMDEQSRVPAVATGRMRDVPRVTSGVAFQMMYGPLLAKNTHKQRLYADGHEQLSLRMLSLCGFGDGTGQDGWQVVTKWPSPLPNDDAATAQLVMAMLQADVSQHALYEVLHLDYDQEQEYRATEAKDAMKAAMQGGALPVVGMPPQTGPNDAGPQEGSPPSPQNNPGPDPNHPAAVAQRNATAAVAKMIKGGQ
jgi:hypothetical protein